MVMCHHICNYLMKLILFSLLAFCLILSARCLVNSDESISLKIEEYSSFSYDSTASEYYKQTELSTEEPINKFSHIKYKYTTGLQDEEEDQNLQRIAQFHNSDTSYVQKYNPQLHPAVKGYLVPKQQHEYRYITRQQQDSLEKSDYIVLIVLLIIVKIVASIYFIWKMLARRSVENLRRHQNPQRYYLQQNGMELRERIRYHQNEVEALQRYFIQVENYQKQQYYRQQNYQFMGYGNPERYYSQSSARTGRSRSRSIDSRRRRSLESPERRLEKYQFGNMICQGVARAIYLPTNQNVIIKTLSKEDPHKVENFLKILRMLPDMSNIVKIVEIVETIEKVYVVMEGGYQKLSDFLKINKKFSEKIAIRIFKQMIYAVEALHNHNISHSKICCELIYINEQMDIKISPTTNSVLIDFFKELKTHKIHYCSPELIEHLRNDKEVYCDPLLCDIWSCGIVFFKMLNNKFPFQYQINHEGEEKSLLNNIQNQLLQIPHTISKGCKMLLLGMLAKNPEQRFGIEEIKAWIQFAEESIKDGVMQNQIRMRRNSNSNKVDERKKRLQRTYKMNMEVFEGSSQSCHIFKRNPHQVFERIVQILNQFQIQFTITEKSSIQLRNPKLRISLYMLEGTEESFVASFSQKCKIQEFILKQLQL